MAAVFFNEQQVLTVDHEWICKLKKEAQNAPNRRARLCLHHHQSDSVQEMIIVMCNDALIRPHKNPTKPESLYIIEGELKMTMFDDDGKILKSFEMGALGSGKPFMIHLSPSPWYTYVPTTKFLVVHETAGGPFVEGETLFPSWAPDTNPELKHFLDTTTAGVQI